MMVDTSSFLEPAKEAAIQAGSILLTMMHTASVREKGHNDLVTDADLAAQQAIRSSLLTAFPDHAWVGEEDDHFRMPDQDQLCWVVDPLDGTANYAHRFPNFAVSIALVKGKTPLLGVVYDPCSGELYHAERTKGAFLNGVPIAVSRQKRLSQALVAASFPPNIDRQSPAVEQFLNVLVRCQSLRRLGAAALNLCYVASGRMDGYWTSTVKPWDVAAGALICTEAGATLCAFDGSPFDVWDASLTVASSQELFQELADCLHPRKASSPA